MIKYGIVATALVAQSGINAVPAAEETIGEIIQKLSNTPKSWTSGPNKKFPVSARPSDFKHLFGSLDIPEHLDLQRVRKCNFYPL